MSEYGVVGAMSLMSPEFLVPIFYCSHPFRMTVFLTSFDTRKPRQLENAKKIVDGHRFSLPIPNMLISSNLEAERETVGIFATDRPTFLRKVNKWIYRFAASVRKMEDRSLAKRVLTNGRALEMELAARMSEAFSAEQGLCELLNVVYGMTIGAAAPRVTFLKRPFAISGGSADVGSERRGLRLLLDQLSNDRAPTLFYEKGYLSLSIGDEAFAIRNIRRIDTDSYELLARSSNLVFRLDFSQKEPKLWLAKESPDPVSDWHLSPFGILTLYRIAAYGTIVHIPWYAKFHKRPRALAGPFLRAREEISATFPKDTNRVSPLLGGGFRLAPSGASLLDYCDEPNVNRFVRLTLRDSVDDPTSFWLLTLIHECGSGRSSSRNLNRRNARLTVQSIRTKLSKKIESGRFPLAESKVRPSALCLLRSIITYQATLESIRKFSHPSSRQAPSRRFKRSIARTDWLVDGALDIGRVMTDISHLFEKLSLLELGKFPALRIAIEDGRVWAADWRSHLDIEKATDNIPPPMRFPDLSSAEWRYVAILFRHLENIAIDAVQSIWDITSTVLSADLFSLFLLIGAEDIAPTVADVKSKRFRKTLKGIIPMERLHYE